MSRHRRVLVAALRAEVESVRHVPNPLEGVRVESADEGRRADLAWQGGDASVGASVLEAVQHFAAARVRVSFTESAEELAGAVRRYLRQFLSDPRVIEVPRWLWWHSFIAFSTK